MKLLEKKNIAPGDHNLDLSKSKNINDVVKSENVTFHLSDIKQEVTLLCDVKEESEFHLNSFNWFPLKEEYIENVATKTESTSSLAMCNQSFEDDSLKCNNGILPSEIELKLLHSAQSHTHLLHTANDGYYFDAVPDTGNEINDAHWDSGIVHCDLQVNNEHGYSSPKKQKKQLNNNGKSNINKKPILYATHKLTKSRTSLTKDSIGVHSQLCTREPRRKWATGNDNLSRKKKDTMCHRNTPTHKVKRTRSTLTIMGYKCFRCDLCNKTCDNLRTVKRHMNKHTGQNSHVSDFCGKQFLNVGICNRHKLIHVAVKAKQDMFKCDVCDKTFSWKQNLRKHLLSHPDFKPGYKCFICGKALSQKCNLVTHTRLHTNEKPFRCDICAMSFPRKDALTHHILRHMGLSGKRPYACGTCNLTFRTNSQLSTHTRTHTGEKPFKCQVCDKYFRREQHVKIHSLVHTDERPFKCDVCGEKYKQKGSLVAHREKQHKNIK
ncbi:unnamed protein product [Lymnaea stagnalis]|uniref:C2H2-type domain-containing protein n=1 Tax=Lymnaea stagnalis TaxID=6523 RepID=A0AAV2I1I3_LYMST